MKFEAKLFKILESNPNRTYKQKELYRLLNIPSYQYPHFRRYLKRLVSEGKILKYKKSRVGVGKRTSEVIGRLYIKTQEYGFLIQENNDADIFINHLNMGTAFNGDLVRVLLFTESKGKNCEGKVLEVIERARKKIVGTFQAAKHWGIVVPDDLKIQRSIYIPIEKLKNAQTGQKVVVRLFNWEDEHLNPEGEIVEVLGYPQEPGVDIISIAKSYDLAIDFSKDVQQEVKEIPITISKDEIRRRADLRNELCFTIDPEDAKDFDDAVSLKILKNGNYLLGVHIADVSYYVKPKTSIDQEAMQRGTSVYLVDRVIPMLPQALSHNICCLKPDQDKLCLSLLIELSITGQLIQYEILESVIQSKNRFTYQEVQQIIENPNKNKTFSETIRNMYQLTKKLIASRKKRGGLNFSTNEVNIELDEWGVPIKIEKNIQLDSHRIIEEFMVLANNIIASHIAVKLTDKRLPFVFRVHEKPSRDKLKDFNRFLAALGFDFQFKKQATPKMFQQILKEIKGSEKQILVEDVMIRSMMKAKYDIKNVGHFGLALKNYCHFTSPIRRYPDLTCHRLLKDYLSNPDRISIKKDELAKICEIATEREITAQEVERASIKIKQLEFMEQHIGEIFDGIISGVVPFGIFVEITKYLIEGLVHITNLPDDYYIHDEPRFCLYGQNNGKIYQLGNHARVRVIQVNREAKKLEFELIENDSR